MRKRGNLSKINGINVVGYLTLCLAVLFLLFFFHNYYFGVLSVLLLLFPFCSVFCVRLLGRNIRIKLSAHADIVSVGEQLGVRVQVENPLWLFSLNGRIKVVIENLFYEDLSEINLAMPIDMHGVSSCLLPFDTFRTGCYRISIAQCRIWDLLGIYCYQIESGSRQDCFVVPEVFAVGEEHRESYRTGMTEAQEARGKGEDSTDVKDIREYRTGDRIRDIHWKLSAREAMLMVKERSAQSSEELCIALSIEENEEMTERLLRYGYNVCREGLASQIPLRLIVWNQTASCFEEQCCGSLEELRQAYGRIYLLPMHQRCQQSIERYMAQCYPEKKSYWLLKMHGAAPQMEKIENG